MCSKCQEFRDCNHCEEDGYCDFCNHHIPMNKEVGF